MTSQSVHLAYYTFSLNQLPHTPRQAARLKFCARHVYFSITRVCAWGISRIYLSSTKFLMLEKSWQNFFLITKIKVSRWVKKFNKLIKKKTLKIFILLPCVFAYCRVRLSRVRWNLRDTCDSSVPPTKAMKNIHGTGKWNKKRSTHIKHGNDTGVFY